MCTFILQNKMKYLKAFHTSVVIIELGRRMVFRGLYSMYYMSQPVYYTQAYCKVL